MPTTDSVQDEIENCGSGTWLNYCETCNIGHAYRLTDVGSDLVISYDECISATGYPNCWAVKHDSSDVPSACAICKRGYFLNNDGQCSQVTPPYCNTTFDKPVTIYNGFTGTSGYYIYLWSKGAGCSQCQNGVAVLEPNSHRICTNSSYIQQESFVDVTTTTFVQHCQNYKTGSLFDDCLICKTNYIPQEDGRRCHSNSGLTSCMKTENLESNPKCHTCNPNFLLDYTKACVSPSIANCDVYNTNFAADNLQKCQSCSNGYYVNASNQCSPGEVTNCLTYKQDGTVGERKNKCIACKALFFKVVQTSKDYCVEIPSALGCSEMTYSSGNTNLTCNMCTNDNQIVADRVTTDAINFCFQINTIENCDVYAMSTSIHASTLVCSSCTADYYLDSTNNVCKERVNRPNNCTAFVEDADKCADCENNTYLDDADKKCTNYPSGILGCEIFSNMTTCAKCKPNFYLDNNVCIKIDPLLTNCVYYADATTCSQCSSTWIVEAGVCVKANATGCLTWADVNHCATCQTQYGIYEDPNNSGVFNCSRINDSRCIVYDVNTPDVCQICQKSYYPNDQSVCTQISGNAITDCQASDTSTTCSRCL
ncbi:MAG: hypothetical protein GY938_07735 [Ketobacter sp.]|nr:hypothetical protein [Ketobacter sp.]